MIPRICDFNREVGNHFQALAGLARGWFLAHPGDNVQSFFPQCWLPAASLSPGDPGGQPGCLSLKEALTQPGMVVLLCSWKRQRKPELPCPFLAFLHCACCSFPCNRHLTLLCPVPVSQLPSRLCLDKGGTWWRKFLRVLAGETCEAAGQREHRLL